MTQQLAIGRVHPRRHLIAAVAELVRRTVTSRPRAATNAAPYDPELHMTPMFALLSAGPR